MYVRAFEAANVRLEGCEFAPWGTAAYAPFEMPPGNSIFSDDPTLRVTTREGEVSAPRSLEELPAGPGGGGMFLTEEDKWFSVTRSVRQTLAPHPVAQNA
jgi:hypothetical protein